MTPPAIELTEGLSHVLPGRALDIACGGGRHSIWLRDHGWQVTAVDFVLPEIDGVTCIQADLEQGFTIEPGAWDLIVCWLYWQADLLPAIEAGVKPGGYVALAGKTTGRFATSLENYRHAFPQWREATAGQNQSWVYYVGQTFPPARLS